MHLDELLQRLKEKGCRMTPQRSTIIHILNKHQHELVSVELLLNEAKVENPNINATTIYRNLELLDELNLVFTQNSKDGSKLYKLVCHTVHHHHIICTKCGKILPIDYCPIAPQLEELLAEQGFTLEEHQLELYGICRQCKSAQESSL